MKKISMMVEIGMMIGINMSLEKDIGIKIDTSAIREGMSLLDSILSWTSQIWKENTAQRFPRLVEYSGANL